MLCIVCLTSFVLPTYTQEIEQIQTKKIPKTTLSFLYTGLNMEEQLRVSFVDWDLRFWNVNKIKNGKITKSVLGGGVKNTYLTLGNIQLDGDAKVFEDVSYTHAWSTVFFNSFNWYIKKPSLTLPLGVKLSYTFFDVWLRLSDIQKKVNQTYHTGLRLVYNFPFYEPQFLYEYSSYNLGTRNFYTEHWYLDRSLTQSLHSFSLVQKFTKKWFFTRSVLRISVPDTEPVAADTSLFFEVNFPKVKLDAFVHIGQRHFINNTLNYKKDWWSQSTQIQIPFDYTEKSQGLVRMRYNIWMKNELREYSPNLDFTKKNRVYASGEFFFQNYITNKKNHRQGVLFKYQFNSSYRRQSIELWYKVLLHPWRLDTSLRTTFYYTEKTIKLTKTTLFLTSYLQYKFPNYKVHYFMTNKVLFSFYATKPKIFEEFTGKAGFRLSIDKININLAVLYSYTTQKDWKFTTEWKCIYSW